MRMPRSVSRAAQQDATAGDDIRAGWPDKPCPGAPVETDFAGGATERLRADFAAHGTVLAWARPGDLLPEPAGSREMSILLGRDRSRFLDLVEPGVRSRCAAARALLKHAAGAVLDRDPDSLELAHGPTGRPYLRGHQQLDCSVSELDGLLVVGLTVRGLIGVHAEPIRRYTGPGAPSEWSCTPLQLVGLAALPEEERPVALARIVTLGEAYGKAVGRTVPALPEFGVIGGQRPLGVLRPDGSRGTGREWDFATFPVGDGWLAGAAVYDTEYAHGPGAAA